jgi:pyruvate dehydrogenase E1 component beta subunit
MRQITYSEAINEALHQEMERDSSVIVYGLGVPDHKACFGSTAGLQERFGKERVFDTPLSEDAMTGFGIGAAINGLRPVHVHIRMDFLLLALNQIANMIAPLQEMSRNLLKTPFVIRAVIGRGWGQGYQHSKSMYSIFSHIPGLEVMLPVTPYEVKGALITAIRSDRPTLIVEHRWLYWQMGEVPENPYLFYRSWNNIVRIGVDITVLATSWMVIEAMKAAEILWIKHGVGVEIINMMYISPLDMAEAINSVKKTGYCIIADNDWIDFGASAEMATRIYENCLRHIHTSIGRIGFQFAHCPTARRLETQF